jgi:hypothetical protein
MTASVPAALVLERLLAELPAVAQYAAAAGLDLDSGLVDEQHGVFYLTFYNRDGETFYAELDCRDYPMYPPTIEFLDTTRTRRGTRDLYPSCFHQTPCVCARYNRKAYVQHGGPHGDWRLVDWQLPTSNGVAINTLALIVSDLHSKIATSTGRLG